MDLRGSQTEKNLVAAFAGESQACNAYVFYAQVAQKSEYPLIADVFDEIAQNEEEHARHFFEFLGNIQPTLKNLGTAAQRERYEHSIAYPQFAKTALEEGFSQIAAFFQRLIEVEKRHEKICDQLLKGLQENTPIQERTTGHSSITLAQVMLPQHANRAGNVHGGEIMKMMDSAAGVVASRHAHANVVTARVEEIDFLHPVKIGDLVMAHASLTFVSRTSMEVRVEVETEDRFTEERKKALTATFIFVALDPSGKAREVPPLLITTEAQEQRYAEGKKRYEARKKK